MWKIILLALSGIAAGVLGGMGMGGGTILIPLLTIFFGAEQKTAQAINLVAFIPMAIVSLIMHFKNGLVEKRGIMWIIVPAALVSALGCPSCSFFRKKSPKNSKNAAIKTDSPTNCTKNRIFCTKVKKGSCQISQSMIEYARNIL